MNDIDDDTIGDPLERRARDLHDASLHALSPRVHAQLHNRLQATLAARDRAPSVRPDWRWAAAPALALALAFILPRDGAVPAVPDHAQIAAAAADAMDAPVAALEQDPEFYAWLASADAVALASE